MINQNNHLSNNKLRNRRFGINLALVSLGMLMLAYASVPLYRIFCQATGFDGVPMKSDILSDVVVDREVTIRFNTDVAPNLQWRFRPKQLFMRMKLGENKMAFYEAENISQVPIVGMATYNVTPEKAAKYFNKVQCFCFEQQVLQPNTAKEFPLSFFISPDMMKDKELDDVHTITLSYTFFKYSGEPK